ncbi:hypothetical protein BDV24DRAFT_167417 [Aspergillus arachidicola]|uniref:Uncharacterized protein n=1 Tax=Aspergillus arachidicola TaxID=656916 RepID=A0A5N6XVW0_9EURO|nr:hypothetical protein BDV24DRAFT_167417 [Aspergillus arachidicola]
MTCAPVLIFGAGHHSGKEHAEDVREQPMTKKHDVLGHFSSILDTWGPGFLISPMDAPSCPVALKTGGGFIFASNDGKCHWAKNMEDVTPLRAIDIEQPLLVGAPVTVNTLCRLVEAKCWDQSASKLKDLGASTSSWEVTGLQVSVSAGNYVNVCVTPSLRSLAVGNNAKWDFKY